MNLDTRATDMLHPIKRQNAVQVARIYSLASYPGLLTFDFVLTRGISGAPEVMERALTGTT